MTGKQRREAARALHRLERAATIAGRAHDDLCNVFPTYGRDHGLRMDTARAADDAARNARQFRDALERAGR